MNRCRQLDDCVYYTDASGRYDAVCILNILSFCHGNPEGCIRLGMLDQKPVSDPDNPVDPMGLHCEFTAYLQKKLDMDQRKNAITQPRP